MKNRFKFRAFSPKYAKKFGEKYLKLRKNLEKQADLVNYFTDKDWIVMQCTGLKDKNGTLIYEGDICRFNWNPILNQASSLFEFECPVEYYKKWSCFAFCIKQRGEEQLSFLKESGLKECWVAVGTPIHYGEEYSAVEIIGNIYETPELLKVS